MLYAIGVQFIYGIKNARSFNVQAVWNAQAQSFGSRRGKPTNGALRYTLQTCAYAANLWDWGRFFRGYKQVVGKFGKR
jgi:hypothetical protein